MGTPRSFGEYVAMRRRERDYSIRQLAKRVDVAPTTITRIVDGSVPHPDLFLALVDVLDLDIITAVKLIEPYHRLYQRINTVAMTRANEEGS